MAVIEHLHIVRQKHGPPESLQEARLTVGRGIVGDHHERTGLKCAVTLIEAETLDDVARRLGHPLAPGSSRRNITTRGIDLDALPRGTRLRIGEVELEVVGPCDPCEEMETALAKGALELMQGRGGLVTSVLTGGRLVPGDPITVIPGERVAEVQRLLLSWFDAHKRDLPWRRTKDPYAIWLSEVMCQQTQVATVIPYWERFLHRFPTVHALASAPLDDVLALWSGLGYYARARNLHRAAQAVIERHGGAFPSDLAALEALPGFGPYTAGAVGSIALDLDAPLVDGNVARVLCRLEGWELGAETAREKAWEVAPHLLRRGRAGDWNQALMELGATVCSPASPSCEGCPLRTECVAARKGEPARYPLPKERRPRKLLRLAALAVRDGASVLLLRRAEKGLFGGLWELPSVELTSESADEAVAALTSEIVRRRRKPARLGAVTQALTHRDVQIEVYSIEGPIARLPEGARWVRPEELPTLGLSTLAVKTLVAARVPVPAGHGRRKAVPPANQRTLFG